MSNDSPGDRLSTIDTRRRAALRAIDKYYKLKGQDPSLGLKPPNKNSEQAIYEKALAILGRVQLRDAPLDRVAEANRLLRFAMLGKWPGVGWDKKGVGWRLGVRSTAIRVYSLYGNRLDEDIKAEYRKRLGKFAAKGVHSEGTENHKMIVNAARLLSRELMGKTTDTGYKSIVDFLIERLRGIGKRGLREWGAGYSKWTIEAILNVFDFSQHKQLRRMARMSLDYILALQSGFTINGAFASGGVRVYPFDVNNVYRVQSLWSWILFDNQPRFGYIGHQTAAEWAASSYSPLRRVKKLYEIDGPLPLISRMKTGKKYDYYLFRSKDVSICSNLSPKVGHFGGPFHDALGVYVQSSASLVSHVVAVGYSPTTTDRLERDKTNGWRRYMGNWNVVIYNEGGVIPAGAPEADKKVPPRLLLTKDFSGEIKGGWAFVKSGASYVAWAPTSGKPQVDELGSSYPNHGSAKWLKATAASPAGVICVLEVGDAAMFGSFDSFKTEILSRNPRPRKTDGTFSYKCRNGETMQFGGDFFKVDGVRFDPGSYPRAELPGVRGRSITHGGPTITFDFDAVKTIAAPEELKRLP